MAANATLKSWCKQFLINHWTNLSETWGLLYPVLNMLAQFHEPFDIKHSARSWLGQLDLLAVDR